jgi:hypothetical protein
MGWLSSNAGGVSQRTIAFAALIGVCILGAIIIVLVYLLLSRPAV